MRDLLAGDCLGYVNLFLETGSGLHNTGHVKRDSSGILVDIQVNGNSYICVHDWNEDGNKDLIIGEAERQPPNNGNIRIYMNDSLNSAPKFKDLELMCAANEPILIDHACPVITDLDRDSLKDLVLGNVNGYIYFFKNRGSNDRPLFNAEYETLSTISGTFIDALTLSRFCFTDWSNDGDLDIVLGGQDGYVWLCENSMITACMQTEKKIADDRFGIMNNPTKLPIVLAWRNIPDDKVDITLYDAAGRNLYELSLYPKFQEEGIYAWHPFDISGKQSLNGVYFLNIHRQTLRQTIKLVILK